MAGLAIIVCVAVVGIGYYIYDRQYRYFKDHDRRGVVELEREIQRRGYSSRFAPIYEETLPHSGRGPPEGRESSK